MRDTSVIAAVLIFSENENWMVHGSLFYCGFYKCLQIYRLFRLQDRLVRQTW